VPGHGRCFPIARSPAGAGLARWSLPLFESGTKGHSTWSNNLTASQSGSRTCGNAHVVLSGKPNLAQPSWKQGLPAASCFGFLPCRPCR